MDTTLIITQQQVTELLTMEACIPVVRDALVAHSTGRAVQPLRDVMWLPDRRGALGSMPAHLETIETMGSKVISIFPGNTDTPYDAHQGVVLLFETEHGRLLAVLDATALTAIRTAAASAVATDALARPDASVLAVLGTGVQAGVHIEAIPLIRDITEIRLWGRNRAKAEALAARLAAEVTVVDTVTAAVIGAGVVCTVTAAAEPILPGALLSPGAHVNAVGSATPRTREVDTEAIVRSRVFTDAVESAMNEAGDLLIPIAEGAIPSAHLLGEIGAVVAGDVVGRTSPEDITFFESLGLGVEDVAAGRLVYELALERGVGTPLSIGGRRH